MPFNWTLFFSRLTTIFLQRLLGAISAVVSFLDLRIGILPKSVSIQPTRKVFISSSKDTRRRVTIHVYEPPTKSADRGPLSVHINFHGSGFVLDVHGSDAEICAYWALTLNCIVLDVNYAKAPAYPYPAAIDDALDVISYVASQPETFDLSRVSLGGFSSGANIAILASLQIPKGVLSIGAVIAWYPPTNLTRAGEEKVVLPVAHMIHRAFRLCYLPPGIDRADPRVSPLFASSRLFPPLTLIVGEDDNLLIDSVELADKLSKDGVDCVLHTVPGAGHAWERFVQEGTPLWDARTTSFALVEERLRTVHGTQEVTENIDIGLQ